MNFVINTSLMLSLAFSANAHQIMLRFQPHITTHAQKIGDLLLITHDKNKVTPLRGGGRENVMSKHQVVTARSITLLSLDSRPEAGAIVTKKQVLDWLVNKVGAFNYQWQGKNTAIVQQLSQTTGTELLAKAQTALTQQLKNYPYVRLELTPKTTPKDNEIPLSLFTVSVPGEYPPNQKTCVRFNYKNHSIPVWFNVRMYQKVLVAKHLIKHHTLIQHDDFILKERNIAGLKDEPVTQKPQSQWLNQTLNKNYILTRHYLIKQPQIIKGQSVQIKILSDGIAITTEAIAQNDGYVGQVIRMNNMKTNTYFNARITAPNQAEVLA